LHARRRQHSCFWQARCSAAAGLVWLVAGTAANGQTTATDSYTATIEMLCRNYATTQVGMPPDQMFSLCMAQRHCRVSAGSADYQCEPPQPMSWHGGGY
jgi:hypothetical protein